MAIVVTQERVIGTSGTLTATYYVMDDGDPPASVSRAVAVPAATDQFFIDFALAHDEYNDEQQSDHSYRIDVTSAPQILSPLSPPVVGSNVYTFNYRAVPELITKSLSTEQKAPETAPPTGGLHNIQLNGTEAKVVGTVVPAGPVTDRLTYQYPAAVISSTYRSTVQSLMGKVNSQLYLGQDPGTMRFVGCSAAVRTDSDQTIVFEFAFRPRRDVTLGGLSLGTVDGWDFPWSYDIQELLDGAGGVKLVMPKPIHAYVDRLLARADFTTLGIP